MDDDDLLLLGVSIAASIALRKFIASGEPLPYDYEYYASDDDYIAPENLPAWREHIPPVYADDDYVAPDNTPDWLGPSSHEEADTGPTSHEEAESEETFSDSVSNFFTGGGIVKVGLFPNAQMGANWKVNDYPKYATAIATAEYNNNIPSDLLARLLYQESRFRPEVIDGRVTSSVGAQGIAQFMPATARDQRVNPLDPFAAINASARYLASLYTQTGSWTDALAAYNWGIGNVRKYRNGQKSAMPAETRNYVAQITGDVPIMTA